MHISNESLLVILIVGLVAGWLAGHLVRGSGFGIIGDIIVGVLGAFIGDWLFPRIATLGAVILLLVVSLLRGSRGGWARRRW
jgi:uncharacterized membrane protein YeaQ/YmgE (transglycosylase-associated protein family)